MMFDISERISNTVKALRASGVEGELRVVPVINKRCFVACGAGNCNCISNIEGVKQWTIVADSARPNAISDFNLTIRTLEEYINE